MKIVIDARMYGLENAGIGRYVNNLLQELAIIDHKNSYLILLRKKYYHTLSFGNNFHKVLADYPHYSIREQLLLPLCLIKLHPDLVHFPHLNVPILYHRNYLVTIHDLIKNDSKGTETTTRSPIFYWFKYLFYRLVLLVIVTKAKHILVPSLYWKKELTKRYHLPSTKIIVTYEGVDQKYFNLKKIPPPKPLLVYTGNLYPHKNLERLIQAIKVVQVDLYLISARNAFSNHLAQTVKKLQVENLVHFLGYLPDEKVAKIYSKATAYVFPSLMEGFGLPGLEAMSVGLPVISSDATCLPEIYGKAALYFDPYDIKDIACKIRQLINDPNLQKKLMDMGYQQAKKYSWEKMAKETLQNYENCVRL